MEFQMYLLLELILRVGLHLRRLGEQMDHLPRDWNWAKAHRESFQNHSHLELMRSWPNSAVTQKV
jgi:hypothetical protein